MGYTAAPLEKLIEQFSQFPGIGRKGATRMAYQVLSMSDADAAALAEAIQNAHTRLHRCRVCQNYTEAELCPICSSAKRDRSTICVVETPRDVQAFERTREYHGLYHVLHGLISPMDGIGAEQLSVKELLARVHAVMRRTDADGPVEKKLTFDKLVVNLDSYELIVDGVKVDTPPKEMELLYHLAASPNRVFTRNQLLDEVWGFDYFGDSRTVDVHVKRLREKLEGVSDKWCLKTVWGVGYKFEVTE